LSGAQSPILKNPKILGAGCVWVGLSCSTRPPSFLMKGTGVGVSPHSVHQHPLWRLSAWPGLMLGMDSLLHPPFFPHALFAGGYWAALCSVALVEEVGEWLSQRRRSASKSRSVVAHRLP